MKEITREALRIYKPISGLDWLNYKIVRKEMTAHHIVKREHGGLLVIDNVAPLMPQSHQYLHTIENKDIERYNTITAIFKIINAQREEPTMEQRLILEHLLQEFEKEHIHDRTSKGKILIKPEYLKRW